ncbi:dual specificity protein phosphatase family protein [Haloferax larsenii]|uniref:Dual specificity protein phosphatase family protein n=1 Tax=Haloferax larsenii TaxID=302484 RepID=A0ABY5RF12_HALLR|nr:dual specificity protein phosphatase [Haloferax larsenii]UVE50952.1 dual specificity protein phosphatase family protein [Haloferax larsenii]
MPTNPPGGGDADSTLHVRPFGYVEPHPVVCRIGDEDLFLGNKHAADPEAHDHAFDFVVSATEDAYPATTHHRPLVDGPGNDWQDFESAVETVRRLRGEAGSVLVHCTAGISRSSMLLATALAAESDTRFSDALARVQEARPHAIPHPALHELAVTYLAATP